VIPDKNQCCKWDPTDGEDQYHYKKHPYHFGLVFDLTQGLVTLPPFQRIQLCMNLIEAIME